MGCKRATKKTEKKKKEFEGKSIIEEMIHSDEPVPRCKGLSLRLPVTKATCADSNWYTSPPGSHRPSMLM